MECLDGGPQMLKKRIAAYITYDRGVGGSFQYAVSLLSALAQLDPAYFEVRLWCSDPAWEEIAQNYNVQSIVTQGSLFSRRPVKRIISLINKIWRNEDIHRFLLNHPLVSNIASWKPDICVSLGQSCTYIKNCKIIGPIHDLMHRYEAHFPEVGSIDIYRGREILYSGHCSTASAILVDSEVGKQHVLEIYGPPPEKIHVLPFVVSSLGTTASRPKNLMLDTGKKFLFYPAQMWLHKNHVNLMRAVSSLPANLDIHCVFSGTTDKNGFQLYQKTLNELNLHEHIHHIGYASDNEILWLYKNARCMIMPSFFGPTNIPPLEAMHYGCPAAVSDIYGMRERYGDSVLYFNPYKVNEIAECIQKLWTDDRLCNNLREKGKQHEGQWTQKDFEKSFLKIFYSIL